MAPAANPLRGVARGLNRAIVCTVIAWSLSPIARAVEVSCVLASKGAPQTSATDAAVGVPLIVRIGSAAGIAADSLAPLSLLSLGALAALALCSFFLLVRSQSPRAGGVVSSLVVFGALALAREEVGPVLTSATPSLVALAAMIGIVAVSAALGWRWVEDVALAAAFAPMVDPLAIDPHVDCEAATAARNGPMARDAASRQLHGALGIMQRVEFVEDSGLSGRGSPIPRVMPSDEPLAHTT